MIKIKTYLKVFHTHKFYTAINIIGLSIGFGLLLVIALLLNFDLGFDRHWSKSDQIYRIDYKFYTEQKEEHFARVSKFLPERLHQNIAGVEGYAVFSNPRKHLTKIGDQVYSESGIIYSNHASLETFELNFLMGNEDELLKEPNQIIISEKLASKWFTDAYDALNKVIEFRGTNYQVQGVFENIPANSHFKFDGLISYETLLQSGRYDEFDERAFTRSIWRVDAIGYIAINEKREIADIQTAAQQYIDEEVTPILASEGMVERLELKFVPLAETHFYGQSDYDQPTGNASFIKILMMTVFIIIIIVIINYTNLSMAILNQRHKELVMRKILGASRRQLVFQIYIESLLAVIIASMIGFTWVFFADAVFSLSDLFKRPIHINDLFSPNLLSIICASALAVSIISVLYPAIQFSQPSVVERSINRSAKSSISQLFIGGQFLTTFVVISSMILMHWQLKKVNSFDLGLNDKNVISIEMSTPIAPQNIELVNNELSNFPEILAISDAVDNENMVLGINSVVTEVEINGTDKTEISFLAAYVDEDYCQLLDIQLLEGKYTTEKSYDLNEVMVNESFAKLFKNSNLLEEPIYHNNATYRIVGVVEDFHYSSLKNEVQPLILFPRGVYAYSNTNPIRTNFHFKIDEQKQNEAIASIEKFFSKTFPNQPFSFRYLTDKINSFYVEDQRDAYFITTLGFCVVLIAIFGLLALVTFEYRSKTKQLCVKKVLGAETQALFLDMNRKQFIMILLACLISMPATFYFISGWLNDYSYKIDLSWTLLLATLFSLILVSFLSLIAMGSKFVEMDKLSPAKVLREN